VVVYVGAVAVLFLFVVMMLDVDFARLKEGYAQYLPIGLAIAALLLGEMVFVSWIVAHRGAAAGHAPIPAAPDVTNAQAIGRVLYTQYVYYFEAAGIVLLIAMIGAIVLTLQHRPHVKRQDIHRQVGRRRKDAVAVISVPTGEGIDE
jgi:NADH-quinone oxidoreductase subunit J